MPSWWSALISPPKSNRPPARKILWSRAIPIYVVVMAVVIGGQSWLQPRDPGNFLFKYGSIPLVAIAALLAFVLMTSFATAKPKPVNRGPGMSKTQRRKQERAARLAEQPREEPEPEPVATARTTTATRPRQRRRRR